MKLTFSNQALRNGAIVLSAALSLMLGSNKSFACTTPAPITGSPILCPPSYTTTLSDATPGGTWSTSDGGAVTVDASGVVTGIHGGMATVTYTVSGGCYVTFNIVNTAITGPAAVCSGSSILLSDAVSGTFSTTSTDITVTPAGSANCPGTFSGGLTSALITFSTSVCSTAITYNLAVDQTPSITSVTASLPGDPLASPNPICTANMGFEWCLTTAASAWAPPFTYNWWYTGPSSGFTMGSNMSSGSHSMSCIMGITTSDIGNYLAEIIDYFGCASQTTYTLNLNTGCREANPGGASGQGIGALSLVPNPSNGNFTITGSADFMSNEQEVNLEITNMIGQIVQTLRTPLTNGAMNQEINLADNLANGLYQVKVSTPGGSKILRATLNR